MTQAARFLLTLLCAVSALFAHSTSAASSLDAPEKAGMRHIGKNVYIDPAMSPAQVELVSKLLEKARKRIGIFYGELVAQPKVIFCATPDCYREFGAVGLGFSDGNNLVISPQGQRVAIIAHELAHVEFSVRIGGFAKVLDHVPQWFDEGQAVMVSMAAEFSEEAWMDATENGTQIPDLNALSAMNDWIRLTGSNGENMQLTYGTAKHEVSRWFNRTGYSGFQALLVALQGNEPFADAYSRIEATHDQIDLASNNNPLSFITFATAPQSTKPHYFMRAAW